MALGGVGALVAALFVGLTALPASATGGLPGNYPNDADRPFVLTAEGVTLTSGTFQSGGHVNTKPGGSLHIEGNNQPGTPFIGKATVTWTALGYEPGDCVTWVQVSGFGYHFGEDNTNRQGGVDEKGWKYCIPGGEEPEPKKVVVCKYVGTPGVDEVLKDGKNPISVSVNALGKDFNGTFPYEFIDAQERSIALGWDDGTEYTLDDCPPGDKPEEPPVKPEDKVVTTAWVDGEYDCGDTTVTQTRTVSTTPFILVDNKWVPGETVTVSETQTRDLTEDERKLYQGDNPEAECYVEVPEPEVSTWIEFSVGCDTEVGDVIPAKEFTRTVSFDLDSTTGEVVARDNTTSRDFDYTVQEHDLGSVEDCEVPPTEPPVTPEEPEEPVTPPVTPEEPEEPTVPATDFDCDDFDTQANAQATLDRHDTDIYGLDADGDGVACDSLTQVQRSGGPGLPATGSEFPWAALLLGGGLITAGAIAVTRRKATV